MAVQKEKKPAAPKAATNKAAAKAPKTPKAPKAAANVGQPPAGAGVIARVLKVTKPLVKGDDVAAVQAALIAKRFHCGVEGANGIYGASTAQAVRHFQSMSRLIVSGRVEKFTAQALGFTWQEDGQPPAPPITPPAPPAGQQPGAEGAGQTPADDNPEGQQAGQETPPAAEGTGSTPPADPGAAPDAGAGQTPADDNPEGQQAGQETPPTQE